MMMTDWPALLSALAVLVMVAVVAPRVAALIAVVMTAGGAQ